MFSTTKEKIIGEPNHNDNDNDNPNTNSQHNPISDNLLDILVKNDNLSTVSAKYIEKIDDSFRILDNGRIVCSLPIVPNCDVVYNFKINLIEYYNCAQDKKIEIDEVWLISGNVIISKNIEKYSDIIPLIFLRHNSAEILIFFKKIDEILFNYYIKANYYEITFMSEELEPPPTTYKFDDNLKIEDGYLIGPGQGKYYENEIIKYGTRKNNFIVPKFCTKIYNIKCSVKDTSGNIYADILESVIINIGGDNVLKQSQQTGMKEIYIDKLKYYEIDTKTGTKTNIDDIEINIKSEIQFELLFNTTKMLLSNQYIAIEYSFQKNI